MMKRFAGIVMAFLLLGGLGSAWGQDLPEMSPATFNNKTYALDESGREILLLDASGRAAGRSVPSVRGRLRALSAGDVFLWAVTGEGEILHSADGSTWTVFDFNDHYTGYYPTMDFRAVAAGGGSVMVAGVGPDGRPAAFVSERGTVWRERPLNYKEDGVSHLLEAEPIALEFDPQQDQFCLYCSGGVLLVLPGCSHCNSIHYL